VIDRPLARALVAELIGTFALVFAGAGAIVVDATTGALGHVGISLVFGLVIMVMIYAVGHVSGAHFNPAVTFAFSLSRHFPWRRALGYWAAQVTGAVLAAALLRASLGTAGHLGATRYSHSAWRFPETSAGPSERAGFIEAPEIGPPNSASRPTVPPIAMAAASPTARVSVATAMITNIRKNVSTTSHRHDWP
jgi:glycerol uptake facilitator-like aquaporin